jgi:hypothetical protein
LVLKRAMMDFFLSWHCLARSFSSFLSHNERAVISPASQTDGEPLIQLLWSQWLHMPPLGCFHFCYPMAKWDTLWRKEPWTRWLAAATVCSYLLTLVPRSWIFLPWSWRRYVPPKRRLTQDLHGATSQKTAFFIVTAVKTSNLTTRNYFPLETAETVFYTLNTQIFMTTPIRQLHSCSDLEIILPLDLHLSPLSLHSHVLNLVCVST